MRFYLAGKYTAKKRLRVQRDMLEYRGHTSVSRWLEHNLDEDEVSTDDLIREATFDLEDLVRAEVFLLDTLDVSETGGREVELGYAKRLGCRVVVIGPRRNIFHHLADEYYPSWADYHLANID